MTHPLHRKPLCQAEDLGAPIPASPHAVSVCLPLWRDVIGYEENEPRVHQRLRAGYPRFVLHPRVREVIHRLRPEVAAVGEDLLPFPDALSASQCAEWVRRGGHPTARAAEFAGLHAAVFPEQAHRHARRYWQHAGRILSSRAAAGWLRGAPAEPDPAHKVAVARTLTTRLAGWAGVPPECVTLHGTGMAAIFRAHEAALALQPGRRTVMFGFPYTDTLKLQECFGPGVLFFPRGNAEELQQLTAAMEHEQFAAIFCELPGNPLLQVPDLPTLAGLARRQGALLIVDDTIGTCHNFDVAALADLVATSLTKAVSGEGDVMGGSLLVSPASPVFDRLQSWLGTAPREFLHHEDLEVLEANSRDFPKRMEASNKNASALAQFLAGHPAVHQVHYPGLHPPPWANRLQRPGRGWGPLLSFLPREAARTSPLIYEALQISRGVSLGTPYTLTCPYVLLAHYQELDWAASCGIPANLLRVSAGTEETSVLLERFARALEVAERV